MKFKVSVHFIYYIHINVQNIQTYKLKLNQIQWKNEKNITILDAYYDIEFLDYIT